MVENSKDRLIDRIKNGGVIVADGAMGTMLPVSVLKGAVCPEELNLTNPEVIRKITESYFEAGAEIIQTNTFGASLLRLAEFGLESRIDEINSAAVSIAKEVAGDNAWVTGSCGPCGQPLLPYGDLDPEKFVESCHRQLSVLIESGVDAVSIETMMDVEEAGLAIRTAKDIDPGIVVIASATFNDTPNGFCTSFGTSLSDVVARFSENGADVVGANCSMGMSMMIRIAREFRDATDKPVLIRPNAGLPEVVDGKTVWVETPAEFAAGAQELSNLGINIIGGCCGTTPDHIRAIRRVIDERK